jgi:hypothetical protein
VLANLLFPNRWLALLWLVSCCLILPAQIRKVDPQRTITFEVAGATAAYSLDVSLAEATADNGLVSVTGNQPGATHIVVITPTGTQTIEILINLLPPRYPPGFIMPNNPQDVSQTGYYEGRYYSNPAEIQNELDFLKSTGDDWTHVHIVETNLVGALQQGQSRTALSSAYYQVVTPRREMTFFDKYVDESPLTINGSMVRGFHMQADNWFVHAGYTSVATFEGLFLPTQPELVVGGGYRYSLTQNSSITASFYRLQVPASDPLGRSGNIGDIRYKYKPKESFWLAADLGMSDGIGAAGQLFYKTDRDTIAGLAQYTPMQFASLGTNNYRGLHTDISWTRHITKKFETDLTFYNNNQHLPGLRESTISSGANLRYQLTGHWTLIGGAIASSFQTQAPPSLAISSFTSPAGVAFRSKHFGATGQYELAVTPGRESGATQTRGSLQSSWGAFTLNGYAERDTNSPELSFIYSQVTGLEQLLDQQGLRATTVQQVDELLSSDAFLIAAGYIKGVTINLTPVRTQFGGTAAWSSQGAHQRHLSYSFLLNNNHLLQGGTEDIAHTLAYSQSVTRSDDISLSCTLIGTTDAGRSQEPICFVGWRHHLNRVPYFVVPERRGVISGEVFQDDQSKGVLLPGTPPIPEVEITLDDRQRTWTRSDGSYRFSGVPRGTHRITVLYHSPEPFLFTTPSDVEVGENAIVNIGIEH